MFCFALQIVKPFLDTKTFKKVKFVYTKNPESTKLVEEHFDFDLLETSFGGRSTTVYNYQDYANQMQLDDLKTAEYWNVDQAPNVSSIKLDAQGKDSKLKESAGKDAISAPAPAAGTAQVV
jgi:hypothetical protein